MDAATKKYLRKLGETVLDRIMVLHRTYDSTGMTRDTMLALFGEPRFCLICGKPLDWETNTPNDVDPWFCSQHCPVCNRNEKLHV